MTPDEYLRSLKDQLNAFPPRERAELFEEIASLFESGEEDPHMGREPEERRQKTLAEMGSPEQLGQGLKKVHHPDGWIDYLLVIGPILLDMAVVYSLHLADPAGSQAFRIGFGLACLCLVLIGLRRHSNLLVLTWIEIFATWVISLLASLGQFLVPKVILDPADLRYTMVFTSPDALQVRWFRGLPAGEGIFWLIMFAGAIYLLGWIIWRNRRDWLIVSYALLELIALAGSYAVPLLLHQAGWDKMIEGVKFRSFPAMMVWMDLPILFTLLGFVMWGMLFIAYKRPLRWAALAGYALSAGLQAGVYMYRPSVYALPEYFQLLLLPLAIVVVGWSLERSKKRPSPVIA